MAYATKRSSGLWQARYETTEGKTQSAGTFPTKKQALAAAQEAQVRTRKRNWHDPNSPMPTWGAWVEEWWPTRAIEPATVKTEGTMLNAHIAPHWRDVPVDKISRFEVQAWATALTAKNVAKEGMPEKRLAASSARRILTIFVSSLSAAVAKGLIDSNPALKITMPPATKGREVYLTRDQFSLIRSHVIRQRDRAILDMLVGTGMRWGELAGLHVAQLDLERGLIHIINVLAESEIKPYPKGRSNRSVPVMQWVVDDLTLPATSDPCGVTHREGRCSGPLLFASSREAALNNRNFSQRVWAPALKEAGLEKLGATLHDLRHTYASWLIQAGVSIERISMLLGHGSTSTTEIYAHLAPTKHSDIEAAMTDPRGVNGGRTSTISHFSGLHMPHAESTIKAGQA